MNATWRIIEGDALERLRGLPDESVHCCITSPPYFGLRDYDHERQIGLEPTPDEFAAALVTVFDEVRRVLRDDGTLWLNLGDSYAANGGHTREGTTSRRVGRANLLQQNRGTTACSPGLKPKDLMGVPWMAAFALRAAGWYLRRDIIWSKPNPMPESVTDRPTSAHEYLFLLTKAPRYYYDAEAIREPHTMAPQRRPNGRCLDETPRPDGQPKQAWSTARRDDVGPDGHHLGRNRRSLWTIATQPYPAAHFATFPPALVEPCVVAGTAPKACGSCGAPYQRVLGPGELDEGRPQARRALELAREHRLTSEHIDAIRSAGISDAGKALVTTNGTGKNTEEILRLAAQARDALGGYYREFLLARPTTVAWEPSCGHDATATACTVLDPFAGAGTTGLVALRLDRSFVGIELNTEYVDLARNRLRDDAPLLNTAAEAAA